MADVNTALRVYLVAVPYAAGGLDLTTLVKRGLDAAATGDRTQKLKALIASATV